MHTFRSIMGTAFWTLCLVTGLGVIIWWGMSHEEPAAAPVPETLFSSEDQDTHRGLTDAEAVLWAQESLRDHPSGVAVPDLGLVSPMTVSGHTGGWLDLPDPPYSTFYRATAPVGSHQGASVIASHVDYGHGEDAPFSALHRIEKGTPVIVKSEGSLYLYRTDAIDLYHRQGLPDQLFRLDGHATGYLVTCSGDVIGENTSQPFYENNLVVTTQLEGKATIDAGQVRIERAPDTHQS